MRLLFKIVTKLKIVQIVKKKSNKINKTYKYEGKVKIDSSKGQLKIIIKIK